MFPCAFAEEKSRNYTKKRFKISLIVILFCDCFDRRVESLISTFEVLLKFLLLFLRDLLHALFQKQL